MRRATASGSSPGGSFGAWPAMGRPARPVSVCGGLSVDHPDSLRTGLQQRDLVEGGQRGFRGGIRGHLQGRLLGHHGADVDDEPALPEPEASAARVMRAGAR